MPHFAHSRKGRPSSEWHLLDEHLRSTAERAERFAAGFAPVWGRLAGLLHDAGKYQLAFQDYLLATGDHTGPKVDHSSVGALIAWGKRAAALAFVVAGHHGGLANRQDLAARMENKRDLLRAARESGLPLLLEGLEKPDEPLGLSETARAMWIRFLFSALVDADYLDTEAFFQGCEREVQNVDLSSLAVRLDTYLDSKSGQSEARPINVLRRRILEDCRRASAEARGFFSLTVPTGGGKTLSSLSFALRHAVRHGLRRVIVVAPFTSIIDQTVKVYREVLGDDTVIEHHSNLDPDHETPSNQTACENWDGAVIVTTAVQFFESLYASRTSRSRKVHRVADSVVVFDEVQTFEPKLLEPIREGLRNLVRHFGVTVVFCTATQPPLELGAREIVTDVAREFGSVRDRCRVRMPPSGEPTSWEHLAAELRGQRQALAIVDRRSDAEELARLSGESCIHLSARMCPEHRLETIERIKERLRLDQPCLAVSTQLVEAGVDIDFPVVYRAFAGAGSMAQAAGRCNREGRRKEAGELRVFFPPNMPPRGILRLGFERAQGMWKEGVLDLSSPGTFEEYYRRVYNLMERDPGVLPAERELRFRDSADLFKMIEEVGEQVVAPYGGAEERLQEIEHRGVSRMSMRRLQPFLVTLYRQQIEVLRRTGAIVAVTEGCRLWRVLPQYCRQVYDTRFGFVVSDSLVPDPESFVV